MACTLACNCVLQTCFAVISSVLRKLNKNGRAIGLLMQAMHDVKDKRVSSIKPFNRRLKVISGENSCHDIVWTLPKSVIERDCGLAYWSRSQGKPIELAHQRKTEQAPFSLSLSLSLFLSLSLHSLYFYSSQYRKLGIQNTRLVRTRSLLRLLGWHLPNQSGGQIWGLRGASSTGQAGATNHSLATSQEGGGDHWITGGFGREITLHPPRLEINARGVPRRKTLTSEMFLSSVFLFVCFCLFCFFPSLSLPFPPFWWTTGKILVVLRSESHFFFFFFVQCQKLLLLLRCVC